MRKRFHANKGFGDDAANEAHLVITMANGLTISWPSYEVVDYTTDPSMTPEEMLAVHREVCDWVSERTHDLAQTYIGSFIQDYLAEIKEAEESMRKNFAGGNTGYSGGRQIYV